MNPPIQNLQISGKRPKTLRKLVPENQQEYSFYIGA
jgi:hypothetical protein